MDDAVLADERQRSSTFGSAWPTASLVDLVPALERLDRLLEQAVIAAKAAYGPENVDDHFRGLHVSTDDVERLLARAPGAPLLWCERASDSAPAEPEREAGGSRLSWLAQAFGLSPFDMDVVLLALAPEIDLRYERLFAFLQDDVTKRWPSVDLALNLLCASVHEKFAQRSRFSPDAPLVYHGVLRLIGDPVQLRPPLLAHYIKLDDQIVRLLMYEPGIDLRLRSFCEMLPPDDAAGYVGLPRDTANALRHLITEARWRREPLRLYFQGPPGAGKLACATALAAHVGSSLLVADLSRTSFTATEWRETSRLLVREAWFQDAILYLDRVDSLGTDALGAAHADVLAALAEDSGITIVAGTTPWNGADSQRAEMISVEFRMPDFAIRRGEWQRTLSARGIAVAEDALDTLADRFRLTRAHIAAAVSAASSRAQLRESRDGLSSTHPAARPMPQGDASTGAFGRKRALPVIEADLFAAARFQCNHMLGALAHKLEPRYTWEDIVLPEDALAQLREICQRVAHRHRVLGEWGFDAKLSLGKGVNALFTGPSGTGKTMAAEIIANELELDLYRIDLAGIVSKYIGETEKNLDRVFGAAESGNGILFFDEADALFGKRSEVRDSHDRYANIEISYLLQKMEEYDGIAILATNLRQNLDEAFMRRLAFAVHFPFPDDASRKRIWEGIWPAEVPIGNDVDLDIMARRFKLSGGNIRNIALASAYLAAEDRQPVSLTHLLQATRREHQKMGKTLAESELDAIARPRQIAGFAR